MSKEETYILTTAPNKEGANNNFKPKVFSDAVMPDNVIEVRERCREFVSSMTAQGHDEYYLICGLFKEIQSLAFTSRNIDMLINRSRDYVRYWERYKYGDDAK